MPRRVVYFPPPRAPMATGFALGLCAAAACSRPPPPPVVYVQRPPPPPQVVYIQQRPPPPMVVPVMPCPAPMMYAPQPTYVPVPVPMPSYPPPPPVSYIDYSQTAPLPPAPAPVMPVCKMLLICGFILRLNSLLETKFAFNPLPATVSLELILTAMLILTVLADPTLISMFILK